MDVDTYENWKPKRGKSCKGKGKVRNEDSKEEKPERCCASPGCTFKVTWHPTHCCAACAKGGSTYHGPHCERQPVPESMLGSKKCGAVEVEQRTPATDEAVDPAQDVLSLEPSAPPRREIPVSLGDGQELSIQWVEGEEPEAVAWRFLAEHGLPQDDVSTIVAFVAMAEAQLQ